MKKVILSLGLLAGISATAQAQISFGVKAGASLTNFTGDDTSDLKSKIGAHGGLVAKFGVNDMFSIQPELLYSMKGARIEFGDEKYASSLNYIDVPVLAKVATGDNGSGLFFELGPQFGFLVSANQESPDPTTGNKVDTDIKELLNTFDFGYAAGLGYQLESGPMIGLRYNGGITKLEKESDTGSTRNSAFQLYVGYMFGGK